MIRLAILIATPLPLGHRLHRGVDQARHIPANSAEKQVSIGKVGTLSVSFEVFGKSASNLDRGKKVENFC